MSQLTVLQSWAVAHPGVLLDVDAEEIDLLNSDDLALPILVRVMQGDYPIAVRDMRVGTLWHVNSDAELSALLDGLA